MARLAVADFAIVSAPAGFGKTSAIRASLASVDGIVAWPRLGSAFRSDAETVADGLLEAARQLGTSGEIPVVDIENSERLGRQVGATLDAVEGPCTLVLDDLHLIAPALQEQVSTALRGWFGDGRHLIVSTRHALADLSAYWPIHTADVIVTSKDLLLDEGLIAAMLGPGSATMLERIVHATGGWAQGVELMHRHLETDPVNGFERAESVLLALISSEVLTHLDDADLELLARLSFCDRAPTSVAERALNRPGSSLRLRTLLDDIAYVAVDDDGIRLTPIFRQALVRHITINDPGEVPPTHVRFAQAWLDEPATAHSTTEAVHHLLEAREFARAVQVLQQRWGVLYSASRVDVLVELMERVPVRYWADDAGCALLLGWANLLIGRGTRALELIQSPPLRTPVGAAIKRLVWAQGVWWSTGPAEALQLVAEGRERLDQLPPNERFPHMPGNDDIPAFRIVADGAEIRARFLLGDLAGSIERLDALVSQPSRLEPISVAGLHAVGALIRAFRGDRNEAAVHLDAADSLLEQLRVVEHYVMFPAHLARALLAVLAGDTSQVSGFLDRALCEASSSGAANFQRLCELVADLGDVAFTPSDPELAQRAARLPLVESYFPVRRARRRADLGDPAAAGAMLKGIPPHELTLSSWVHVLLMRHPLVEVRSWLSTQRAPVSAHGQVVRLMAEATVADTAAAATGSVRRAVAIASDRRLLGVIVDAPSALWARPEIAQLDLPMLADVRRLLQEGRGGDELRFTTREIELLKLLARSATAAEIAARLFVSVNTIKWHKANIYRKLDVNGSRRAVQRAAELGVLDAADLP